MAHMKKSKGPVPHPNHEVVMVPMDRAVSTFGDTRNLDIAVGLTTPNPSSVPPQNMAY